jgi:hypothetical protein
MILRTSSPSLHVHPRFVICNAGAKFPDSILSCVSGYGSVREACGTGASAVIAGADGADTIPPSVKLNDMITMLRSIMERAGFLAGIVEEPM